MSERHRPTAGWPPNSASDGANTDSYEANEVSGTGERDASSAGATGDTTRHQFVGVWRLGDQQPHVVE